jgi:hypothetical protein
MKMITIVEFQGIKCSARSFQMELELKQMMVLNQTDLFEKCILGAKQSGHSHPNSSPDEKQSVNENLAIIHKIENENTTDSSITLENTFANENIEEPINDLKNENENEVNTTDIPSDFTTLTEFEIDLDKMNDVETVQIKNRNDVYYEMYIEARKKAKMARKIALEAYLEAKHIKNLYKLDDIESESESETSEPDIDDDTEKKENIGQLN